MLIKANKTVIAGVVIVVAIAGAAFIAREPATKGVSDSKIQATIYKSPTCSCCLGHGNYLDGQGFDVETVVETNIASVKQEHNIPPNMQSCHTTIIGDYFVEGHVPVEAINKLLLEQPEIDGIALPAMPAGSPGMPGVKRGEFIIYSLKDGQSSEFVRL